MGSGGWSCRTRCWGLQPVRRAARWGLGGLRGGGLQEAPWRRLSQRALVLGACLPGRGRRPFRREQHVDVWTQRVVPTHEPDQTLFVWFAEVGEHATTLWANFQGADPNTELVEVNVRRSVFYPEEHHLDWITVRGSRWRRPRRHGRRRRRINRDSWGRTGPRAGSSRTTSSTTPSAGHLPGQGGIDRRQLLHGAGRQARLPVPDRVGVRRSADRVGQGAHRVSRGAWQHDLRLWPDRDRRSRGWCSRPSRTTTSIASGSSASSSGTRSAASSCTPRSTRRSATTASTTARWASGWTGRHRAPGSRATCCTATTATCSSRCPTGRTWWTTTSSGLPPRSRWSARAAPTSTTSSPAACAWNR